MELKVIPKQGYKRATWKNGLGFTDQIAIHPETADLRKGDFLWRLSSARIEQASPFSSFPFHDRFLVVLEGEGLHLTHSFEEGAEPENVDLPPLEPYEFPGDIPTHCSLISGGVTDFSVFIRKAEVEAVVEVIDVSQDEPFLWVPAGRWNFAFAAEGHFTVESTMTTGETELPRRDCLRVDLDRPLSEDEAVRIRVDSEAGKLVIVGLQG